jgi:hypothetical protein
VLVKLAEDKLHITQLRSFLLEHPLLVLELGFLPVWDATQLYGFDIACTVLGARWLRHKQQHLNHDLPKLRNVGQDVQKSCIPLLRQVSSTPFSNYRKE